MQTYNMMNSPSRTNTQPLPVPTNLSYMWNMGSMLSLSISIQIVTGILLTMHYTPNTSMAFSSIWHVMREVNLGWFLKYIHMNGASMMFLLMYIHMGRNLYFGSPKRTPTWTIGVMIYILTMATAFMGYLLPWGQMSFWGATVITNMFSAIPYLGTMIVEWLWGGFAVSNPTLSRFFTLHFLLPLVISLLALLHLLVLHSKGSNNPLGMPSTPNKIPFHPLFSWKDLVGFSLMMTTLFSVTLLMPNNLNDPENFIPASPLVTPTHIKPEWYFLWAYAILRSIPNKLGGVMIMVAAILSLFLFSLHNTKISSSNQAYSQYVMWCLFTIFALLTWIGNNPVESPYVELGGVFTTCFFILMVAAQFDPPHMSIHI